MFDLSKARLLFTNAGSIIIYNSAIRSQNVEVLSIEVTSSFARENADMLREQYSKLSRRDEEQQQQQQEDQQ